MSNNPLKTALEHIQTMTSSRISNYAIAGLTSELLTEGTVRLFSMENVQTTKITPHSHRFNLASYVLQGSVENTIWYQQPAEANLGHLMALSKQEYKGVPGKYSLTHEWEAKFTRSVVNYEAGEFYYMDAEEIHSIEFSPNAVVLIFAGPDRYPFSTILEPVGRHGTIPIQETRPWMFKDDD